MKKLLGTLILLLLLVDKDDIRALKLPVALKEEPRLWPFIILVLLFIGGAAAFMYFRKKSRTDETPPVPPRPPEEISMEKLKLLLEMRLVESGRIKEYYINLSDIIRNYIEGRYRIFAMDRTTWELYQEMRGKKIERLHVDMLRDFLEDCDLVKFAKYIPLPKEIEEAYDKAKEIIEITTPRPIIPNEQMTESNRNV